MMASRRWSVDVPSETAIIDAAGTVSYRSGSSYQAQHDTAADGDYRLAPREIHPLLAWCMSQSA